MGNTPVKELAAVTAANVTGNEAPKPKCKACCACPETKRARDECIIQKGEPNCQDLIEAHKRCMREQGFNI